MSRTERLLDLLQVLRTHRQPIAGSALAEQLGISIRTLYRDIATLQAQGADIAGEPGIGYVLRPGFMLPPLMFSTAEIEALVLGMRWVSRRSDDVALGNAATHALAKIAAVLPASLRDEVEAATLLVGPPTRATSLVDMAAIRDAIRAQRKLRIVYGAPEEPASERTVWPFAIGFFETIRIVVAWCELRQDFRHFRTDRIKTLVVLDERYRRSRQALLKDWRQSQGIAATAGN